MQPVRYQHAVDPSSLVNDATAGLFTAFDKLREQAERVAQEVARQLNTEQPRLVAAIPAEESPLVRARLDRH